MIDPDNACLDRKCFCSDFQPDPDSDPSAQPEFIQYPDSACNFPCPGDPAEKCGGIVELSPTLLKRQISTGNPTELVLLTLYKNTLDDVGPESSNSSSSSGPTLTPPSQTSSSSPPLQSSASNPKSLTSLFSSSSATQSPNSATPSGSSSMSPVPPPSSSLSSGTLSQPPSGSSSLTLTLSPTTISTTYITVCAMHSYTCPIPTATRVTTTVTLLHCGCTEMSPAEVPMTTTVVPFCPNSGAGSYADAGIGIAPVAEDTTLTTLTIPCTSSITAMQSAVDSWSASAHAAAAAAAEAAGSTFATASAGSQAPPYSSPPAPLSMPWPSASLPVRPTRTFTLAVATENLRFPNLTHVSTGVDHSSRQSPSLSSSLGSSTGSAAGSAPAPGSGSGAASSSAAMSRHQISSLLLSSSGWSRVGFVIAVVVVARVVDWADA